MADAVQASAIFLVEYLLVNIVGKPMQKQTFPTLP